MSKHIQSTKSYNWGNQYCSNGHVVKTNSWVRK